MGIFKSTKKVTGKLVDVRVDKWMSWDYLTETAEHFKILLIDSVIPKKATGSETFEEAMKRLELTEADLERRKREFTQLFYFFLTLSIVIVCYALYVAFTGGMVTSIIAFCLAMYAMAQAFRFHFWLFQVKHRKLGCTIKEWLNAQIVPAPKTSLTVNKTPGKMTQTQKEKAKE